MARARGFEDRREAGRLLAQSLRHLAGPDIVVLGLPRGGIPVAYEVAVELDAPLDVVLVRKLGVPYQPELAMGALGEGGIRVLDDAIVGRAGVSPGALARVEDHERAELNRRAAVFRGDRKRVDLEGRTAIVVDDGIATGSTVRAAVDVVRAAGARRVVVATPVAPPDVDARLDADEVVVVERPRHFAAIGQFYRDFRQTSDAEVVELLERAGRRP